MTLLDRKEIVDEKVVEETLNENPQDLLKEDSLLDTEKEDEIIDIASPVMSKKRFRLDGDNNRILELNISDLFIVDRLNKIYPKLQKYAKEAGEKLTEKPEGEDTEAALERVSASLKDIDAKMRGLLDEMFDSKVADVCAPSGSMYDPVKGKFRFEHIIEMLSGLYENNFRKEFKEMSTRIEKHTNKYVKK